jgi:hypothetical protein
MLPTLHVATCVQLLKQCKRLKFLRLYFESDLIFHMSPNTFKSDSGICELCSVRGIKTVRIWNLGYEPIDQCDLAKWLEGDMESPRDKEENERGIA